MKDIPIWGLRRKNPNVSRSHTPPLSDDTQFNSDETSFENAEVDVTQFTDGLRRLSTRKIKWVLHLE